MLHRIGAVFDQGQGGFGAGDVTTDHLHFRVAVFDALDALEHVSGVTVGGIDHEHVHARFHQRCYAVVGVGAGAHAGAHAQAAFRVFAGVGVFFGFVDVFYGDQAAQLEVVVDHEHFLNAVLVQQLAHFVVVGAFFDGHQLVFRGHDTGDFGVVVGLEAHVASGDNAHQVAVFQHRQPGEVVLAGQGQQVADGGIGIDGDGVFDHTGFVFFHHAHLLRLLLDAHTLVDDPDATVLRHGNGQAGFGHGVHGSRDQRDIQLNTARQPGLEGNVFGSDVRVARQE